MQYRVYSLASRRWCGEVVGKAVGLGERMRKMNVVEALEHPNTTFVSLGSEPTEHCDVLFKLFSGELLGFGILG